jgi:hypothetical protein
MSIFPSSPAIGRSLAMVERQIGHDARPSRAGVRHKIAKGIGIEKTLSPPAGFAISICSKARPH